jgi:hypothetical protein
MFTIILLVGLNISYINERLFQIVDIFSSNQQLRGSSIEMRMGQLKGSLAFFGQNIFTGNGFFYIADTIGFHADSDLNKADEDMWGFESYIFELLIEQGIAGIIASVVFFGTVLYWLYRQRKYSIEMKQAASLGIAITTCFLFFSFSTGTLGAWYISMFLLGVTMKRVLLMKH